MKARILIIDDEELILMGWKYTLMSAGYHVNTALSGKDALKILKKDKPDIVITDLIMSEMNGIEICKTIKSKSPEIEVILVSGHPDENKRFQQAFVEAGGWKEILKKPLSKEEIIAAVEAIENDNKERQKTGQSPESS